MLSGAATAALAELAGAARPAALLATLAQAGGLILLAAGLLALVLAAPVGSWVLLAAGAVLAGAGHGIAYLAAQDELNRIAPAGQRGMAPATLPPGQRQRHRAARREQPVPAGRPSSNQR
jgi:hypothetical protein